MKILDLPVETREKLGSANSRRYRRAGKIPCILYGRGQESIPLVTTTDGFGHVLKNHSALVRLKLDADEQTALVRAVEWDTFGRHVEHIDLIRVEMDEEVKVSIPLRFVGIPVGVGEGGIIEVVIADLAVFARVDSIPTELGADISHLHIGSVIHVKDLEYPENVRPAVAESVLLMHVVEPRKVEEPEPDELAVAAEGEAPEGTEEDAGAGEKATDE